MPRVSECGVVSAGVRCTGRRVSVRYTEAAYANFSDDGTDREDGNEVEAVDMDWSQVYCRHCGLKRTLTEFDVEILENYGELDEADDKTGKDEEGQ